MSLFIRVQSVEPRDPFVVHVRFTNGEEREIDLDSYLRGPIFEPLRDDLTYFRQVRVEGGTIAWPNGADLDPDVLYLGLSPNASQAEWEAARALVATSGVRP
jgi:hypothetical protein